MGRLLPLFLAVALLAQPMAWAAPCAFGGAPAQPTAHCSEMSDAAMADMMAAAPADASRPGFAAWHAKQNCIQACMAMCAAAIAEPAAFPAPLGEVGTAFFRTDPPRPASRPAAGLERPPKAWA
jgi:hypothetical protein